MKILKMASALIISTIVSSANTVLAADNNYYANYYEEEGNLLFKVRGFYLNASSKPKGFPPSVAAKEKPGSLVQNGYGVDTATTYFFTDNIAADLSLGVGMMRVKSSTLSKAASATSLGDGTGSVGKNNQIIMVPAAGAIQYHIAPFGAIRPYLGAGIHGTYMHTRSKAIKVATGYGPVIQVGIDFIAKDDTLFTFDVRQYFLKSNVTFKKNLLGPNNAAINDVRSKVTWNPLVISAGFGFKF
jgi:outer membrane protein